MKSGGHRSRRLAAILLAGTCFAPILRRRRTRLAANPGSGIFNTPGNWSTGSTDRNGVLRYQRHNQLEHMLLTIVGGLTFNAGAPAYSFSPLRCDVYLPVRASSIIRPTRRIFPSAHPPAFTFSIQRPPATPTSLVNAGIFCFSAVVDVREQQHGRQRHHHQHQ